jgi:hypothetical protein
MLIFYLPVIIFEAMLPSSKGKRTSPRRSNDRIARFSLIEQGERCRRAANASMRSLAREVGRSIRASVLTSERKMSLRVGNRVNGQEEDNIKLLSKTLAGAVIGAGLFAASTMSASAAHRIAPVGPPCRRLVFSIHQMEGDRHYSMGVVKLVLPAEVLVDIAQMLAADIQTGSSMLASLPASARVLAN